MSGMDESEREKKSNCVCWMGKKNNGRKRTMMNVRNGRK
jgi:hypothetical protein